MTCYSIVKEPACDLLSSHTVQIVGIHRYYRAAFTVGAPLGAYPVPLSLYTIILGFVIAV